MFVWEALTSALDEMDAIRAQFREARGQSRSARFYELLRAKLVLSQGGGKSADVIEMAGGWAVVHWTHDPKSVGLYSSMSSLRSALCAEGTYLLSLVDASDQTADLDSRRERPKPQMSRVQKQLLRGISHGLSNSELAQSIGMSPSTVKNNLVFVYRILGVHDRTQAALMGRDLNLDLE